jgi:hypothetical protein
MKVNFNEHEAARLTGLSLSTLRQARSVRKGELNVPQHHRLDGKIRIHYSSEQLMEWFVKNGLSIPSDLQN